ncbi:putative HET domain-containing protein [Rosellinia necatrix]|uniref:Putative HET domain-containing protein n=1 Tax=Rosellinia necatrix TaxID=77044 RepID=A0A1S8AAE8_ROSNE|nr:putative HET domain-containing protein [Rosellinia necatrix]
MTWAHMRETTRPEDRAYSLMGIFDVNMPLLYGEGGAKAFDRLQEEIINGNSDQSILLHRRTGASLASSPDDFSPGLAFERSPRSILYDFRRVGTEVQVSLLLTHLVNQSLFVPTSRLFIRHAKPLVIGIIESVFADDATKAWRPAVMLSNVGTKDKFYRLNPDIWKVQLNTSGDIEMVPTSHGRGERISLNRHQLERRIIGICKEYDWGLESAEPTAKPQYLCVRPIVHTTTPSLIYNPAHYRHTAEDPAVLRIIEPVLPHTDCLLLAAIPLYHPRGMDFSVVVVIFGQLEIAYNAELGLVRRDSTFPSLVNLGDWLALTGERDIDPFDLQSICDDLMRLLKIHTFDYTSFATVRSAILGDTPKMDSTSVIGNLFNRDSTSILGDMLNQKPVPKFSLPMPDGTRIRVSLDWGTFLEEDVLYFGVVTENGNQTSRVFPTALVKGVIP